MTATVVLQQIQARQKSNSLFDGLLPAQMAERITEFKEDPLVLACTVKRLQDEGKGYRSIDSEDTVAEIIPQDRILADHIKEYYTKKFFWLALSDSRSLSDYRIRLINLLENNIRKCKDQDCGIYYKLPYFYQEDQTYERFKKIYKTNNLKNIHLVKAKEYIELDFIERTLTSQRKRKVENIWFTDGQFLFCIHLEQNNPLLEIFLSLIDRGKKVEFHSYKTVSRIDQMHFYKLYQYNLVK